MRSFFVRLFREPLVHFVTAAGLVFAVYSLVEGRGPENRDITITTDQIEQLTAVFRKTWQRPPSDAEVKSMLDDYVKEEVYVREALRLGLDEGDTVIRRRLRQKMEFMVEEEAEVLPPSEGELAAFFRANKALFEVAPQLALQQVFISHQKHGDAPEDAATAILQKLRANPSLDISGVGDPSMLPQTVPLSPLSGISSIFGPAFADQVAALPSGEWDGPIRSEFGLHLVRITQQEKSHVPQLAQISGAVLGKWRETKLAELEKRRLEALLKEYHIRIDLRPEPGKP